MRRFVNELRMYLAELLFWPIIWMVPKDHPQGLLLLRVLGSYATLTAEANLNRLRKSAAPVTAGSRP